MQQQIDQEESNIEQDIKTVFDNFAFITTNVNGEFPEITKDNIVLIFLGDFEQNFHTFYQHFQIKQVIFDTNYYKLIKIEKQGKISYLFNFPLILQYDGLNNEMQQNLCISKIYAEKAFQKMQKCKFQLIVDVNQLKGENEQEKANSIICDSAFYFGKYYFQENQFLFLRPQSENQQWNLFNVKKSSQIEYSFQSRVISLNEVLKNIFQINSYISLQIINSDDFLNYGKMMIYLKYHQDLLGNQFKVLLKNFQKQLLFLQQMPISQDNTNQIVENYLTELQKGFTNIQDLTNSFAHINKVFTFINQVNRGNIAIELNQRIQQKNSRQMKQFLYDNKIENLCIQPFFNDEVEKRLNQIINFLVKYHKNSLKINTIIEVQNLRINLTFWCQNCKQAIENTLYELKYIVKRIQEGPKNKIENGIYFIGITKSGKSTIINAILNPNKLQTKKILSQKCYIVEQGFQTKFQIGEGLISETQKISGIYTGKKEDLDKYYYNQENQQNFNQLQEQDVISYEELPNMELINEIPENWFIFDCPGFDHNSNELMRIAHRISLYNYFHQTKNIIVYFIIDISVQQLEQIQNTFDPICCLLKNKNDIQQNCKDWTNLILTKAEKDQRQEYLQNWELAYKGQLEQNYGFYKQLFADNERCIEFVKPSEEVNTDINKLVNSIIQIASKQFQQQKYNPAFELFLDEKLWILYERCMPKIKMRLEQLLELFLLDIDQYVLNSNDTIEDIKEQITKLKNCILSQEQNRIIREINLNNCISILQKLSQWIQGNQYAKEIGFFLDTYIQDIMSIFQISKYCKNNFNIMSFIVKIDKLVSKIEKILQLIQEADNYCRKLQKICSFSVGTIITAILICGGSYAYLPLQILIHNTKLYLLTAGVTATAAVTATTFSGKIKKSIFSITDNYKLHLFQDKYKLFLQNEQNHLE